MGIAFAKTKGKRGQENESNIEVEKDDCVDNMMVYRPHLISESLCPPHS